jgi:hypothetical protein
VSARFLIQKLTFLRYTESKIFLTFLLSRKLEEKEIKETGTDQ